MKKIWKIEYYGSSAIEHYESFATALKLLRIAYLLLAQHSACAESRFKFLPNTKNKTCLVYGTMSALRLHASLRYDFDDVIKFS